jgi:hypothetical protein
MATTLSTSVCKPTAGARTRSDQNNDTFMVEKLGEVYSTLKMYACSSNPYGSDPSVDFNLNLYKMFQTLTNTLLHTFRLMKQLKGVAKRLKMAGGRGGTLNV